MTNPIKTEPAALAGFLPALATGVMQLLATFKVPISTEQATAIVSLIAILAGFWVRSRVSPVQSRKPQDPPAKPPSVPPVVAAMVGLLLVACAAKPEAPPCDPATALQLSAEAALAGERCAAADVPEGECTELAAVNKRADERQALCSKRIQEEE